MFLCKNPGFVLVDFLAVTTARLADRALVVMVGLKSLQNGCFWAGKESERDQVPTCLRDFSAPARGAVH